MSDRLRNPEQASVQRVADALVRDIDGMFPPETVERFFGESFAALAAEPGSPPTCRSLPCVSPGSDSGRPPERKEPS